MHPYVTVSGNLSTVDVLQGLPCHLLTSRSTGTDRHCRLGRSAGGTPSQQVNHRIPQTHFLVNLKVVCVFYIPNLKNGVLKTRSLIIPPQIHLVANFIRHILTLIGFDDNCMDNALQRGIAVLEQLLAV